MNENKNGVKNIVAKDNIMPWQIFELADDGKGVNLLGIIPSHY